MEVNKLNKKGITNIVSKIAEPIASTLGFDLVDIEYIKEKANYFLRIYIDKPGGVSLDDCQEMSQRVGDVLDKEDPISTPYFLEVSSPGLDRPLKNDKDLKRNLGKEIEVKLYKQLNNQKQIIGILEGFEKDYITIKKENNDFVKIERELIALIKLVIKF